MKKLICTIAIVSHRIPKDAASSMLGILVPWGNNKSFSSLFNTLTDKYFTPSSKFTISKISINDRLGCILEHNIPFTGYECKLMFEQ